MNQIFKTILFFLILFICPIMVYSLEYPELNSKMVEVYDLTDQKVLYEIDSKEIASIASLTKIATTITAIETISNLEEEVTITRGILNTVQWDASKAGLKVGDQVTYQDLLYAAMLPSGADATNALAILSSGSIENFVSKMNELATKLELENTHFVNVTGLDAEGHYSTADDVRKLLAYALKNELFRTIYTTREYTLTNGLLVQSTLAKYSGDTSVILGSKTGYTGDAGYCLSTLSKIHSHEFLVIVLNAEHKNNQYYHIVDSVNLIRFLLEHYQDQLLIAKGELIKTIPVKFSKVDNYELFAEKDITLYLPDDYDKEKIKVEYNGSDSLSFRNKIGDGIGTITYYYDQNKIYEQSIILKKKLPISISKILQEYFYFVVIIPVLILLLIIIMIRKRKKKNKR